jgi:hypothetical protein
MRFVQSPAWTGAGPLSDANRYHRAVFPRSERSDVRISVVTLSLTCPRPFARRRVARKAGPTAPSIRCSAPSMLAWARASYVGDAECANDGARWAWPGTREQVSAHDPSGEPQPFAS